MSRRDGRTGLTADAVDVDGVAEVFFDRGAGEWMVRRADGGVLALEGGDSDDWPGGGDVRRCTWCGKRLGAAPDFLAPPRPTGAAGRRPGRPRAWRRCAEHRDAEAGPRLTLVRRVYKAVARHPEDPEVWCSLTASGQGLVCYRVGEPAEAPAWLQALGYHVLAFRTAAQAARALHGYGPPEAYAVFEAVAEGVTCLLPRVPARWLACRDERAIRRALTAPLYADWPAGTITAQRLTLRRCLTAEVRRAS